MCQARDIKTQKSEGIFDNPRVRMYVNEAWRSNFYRLTDAVPIRSSSRILAVLIQPKNPSSNAKVGSLFKKRVAMLIQCRVVIFQLCLCLAPSHATGTLLIIRLPPPGGSAELITAVKRMWTKSSSTVMGTTPVFQLAGDWYEVMREMELLWYRMTE